MPITPFRGVRTSCETVATNFDFAGVGGERPLGHGGEPRRALRHPRLELALLRLDLGERAEPVEVDGVHQLAVGDEQRQVDHGGDVVGVRDRARPRAGSSGGRHARR